MNEKEKGKVKSEKGTAKMTAEQKELLAAAKSVAADVARAKDISVQADFVLRDLCKSCNHRELCADDRKKIGCLSTLNCRMSAIASVAVGMILEAKGGAK